MNKAYCQKCLDDARPGSPEGLVLRYRRLISERFANPCSPEEQAGEHADRCPVCGRMTLHPYAGICMNQDDCVFGEGHQYRMAPMS